MNLSYKLLKQSFKIFFCILGPSFSIILASFFPGIMRELSSLLKKSMTLAWTLFSIKGFFLMLHRLNGLRFDFCQFSVICHGHFTKSFHLSVFLRDTS